MITIYDPNAGKKPNKENKDLVNELVRFPTVRLIGPNGEQLGIMSSREAQFKEAGFRVKIDDSNEKLGYRMRSSQISKIPYTIVIGDNEKNNNQVTYRKYGQKEQIAVDTNEFIKMLADEIKNKK